MFYSHQFLSKKGPLGSIWVAAYCLKRLHRDQIAQTDIPSSVDKILTDEWPTVTYRILGYLLLGVVRIYSKKVEFVLHDCRDTITKLNKSVGKKKAVSFREIVHAQDFSLTLPERYELDAFVLEVASDVNKAHIAENADITIPGECLRNDKIFKRSIKKRRGQGTTTPTVSKASAATIELEARSSGLNAPESPEEMETCSISLAMVNCREFNMEASSSQHRRSLEESIEEFREIRFSREECLDFDMFYQNDPRHIGIFESSNIIQSANVEQSDLSIIMQTEKDGRFCSGVEDETPTVEKNRDVEMPSDIHEHDAGENEANFTVQASPDLNMPSNNDKYVDVEDEVNFTDKSLALVIAPDNYETVTAVRTLAMTSSNDKYVDVEDGVNFTDKSPNPEIASDNYETVTAVRKPTITDSERASQSDRHEIVSSEKDKQPLNVQTTPDLKIPDVKDPSSTELLAVRTPATKERRIRKSKKRKCIFDDFMVLSNETLKRTINDASDLLRKRRKVPHTSLEVWRLSCNNRLPQKFMEPLISWTVMDPKDIQRKDNNVDRVETREASDIPVMAVSLPRSVTEGLTISPVSPPRSVTEGLTIAPVSPSGSVIEGPTIAPVSPPRCVTDGLTIAPGTPTRCSTSTRSFLSPKAADSDGEGPFLPLQTVRRESPCQSFGNARRDLVADIVEEIVLDLMDKDMEQNGESQELDGWSTRTRTVARWLHQVFVSKEKRNEARTANLSQLLGGKTRKEGADVFYEILVLRSGEYVNVSQERSYDDILLQETSKMEAKLAECPV